MAKFKKGDRVILREVPEDGIPEERGVVIDPGELGGIITVQLDDKYIETGWDDDGLREVEASEVDWES